MGAASSAYHKTYSEPLPAWKAPQVSWVEYSHAIARTGLLPLEPGVNHLFRNRSGKPCRFGGRTAPGQSRFRRIPADWLRTGPRRSMPEKRFAQNNLALSWLFEISENNLPVGVSIFEGFSGGRPEGPTQGTRPPAAQNYVRFDLLPA